ncbi:hypothetical protein Taro_010036 [Colocasia esculenta]|uniref:DUF4378 domain-containing protein n=1 Tax=Colocasia esculenta TaxID=4460 RepID=A0A843U6K1_COLES|nr:hypothetical protein [Colocasia esculenta]
MDSRWLDPFFTNGLAKPLAASPGLLLFMIRESKMGTEKTGVRTGGLFNLFDWNRKSRKKLFVSGNVSPEGANQGTKSNDNVQAVQASRPCPIEDDDTKGLSSVKGSSDYSCASSVTDEEGNGIRAPGVVARLMGLDSLPTTSVSEPYSTPLFDSRSLRENCYRKRGPELHIDDDFSNVSVRSDCYARKPFDVRSQKMPSSPIERFQTEVLPPRSAKSLSITHYKLLSPIKNPSFASGKNAAHIMEAAAKILEPGLRVNAKGKAPSIGSSSLSLEVQDSKENIAVSHRLSRLPESPRRPLESNTIRYLKSYSLNKSWNAPEDSVSVRTAPEWGETSSSGAKGKGKTLSLAVQAKVNIQKREGSTSSSRSSSVHGEQDESKINQSLKSQKVCKNKLQKNSSVSGPSGVLKQNNQKQNCLSNRDKIAAKSSVSNQQVKKVPCGDANSRKNRILNNTHGSSKVGHRKEDLQATDFEKDGCSSSTKNAPRKKRLIQKNYQSDSDTILVANHEKRVQSSVMIDEHRKWDEDSRRNGTDIVSFTFTSPIIKPSAGSQLTHITKSHGMSSFSLVMEGERNTADAKTGRLPSVGLNVISGDALSVLLEQKLRELTSGLQAPSSNVGKVGDTSASLYPGLILASENSHDLSMECQKESSEGDFRAGLGNVSDDSGGDGPLNICTKLQGVESMAECSSSGSVAQKEPGQPYPSPLSILEASFSSESCSSDGSDSNNGNKICSSVGAQDSVRLSSKNPSGEAEMDLSDSASSLYVESANEEQASGVSRAPTENPEQELEYIREVIRSVGIDFEGKGSGCMNYSLDPLLFDMLENKKTGSRNRPEDKNHRAWRKVVFDCIGECLESKCSRYFKAGCQAWAKGIAVIGREDQFANEVYKEISCWKSMGDWMVDELVDKDMSSHLGRWADFEVEAFEAGVEIEEEVISCLIDEVVADFIM